MTELETSARTESKQMTNNNTPQLSRMNLANHCAAFPGLSPLNTRAVHMRKAPAMVSLLQHSDNHTEKRNPVLALLLPCRPFLVRSTRVRTRVTTEFKDISADLHQH
jgi:hypothetical protein